MQTTQSLPSFDQHGRAIPLPPEEERRRQAEARNALKALAEIGDEEEQAETFAALVEAVDRDPTSYWPRFA